MMNKEYWEIKILIFIKTKNKLRDGLKTYNNLKSAWDLASLDTKLSTLIKKHFFNALIKTILHNKYKIRVKGLFCNKTCFFIYKTKLIKSGKFPNPEIFHVNNS